MKGLFGIVSLLVTLAIVGLLAKKQLTATQQIAPGVAPNSDLAASAPGGTVKEQASQVQQQYKQALEATLQAPRTVPDDK